MYRFKTTWTQVVDSLTGDLESIPDLREVEGVEIIDMDIVWGAPDSPPDESVLTIDCSPDTLELLRSDERFTEVVE